MNNEARHPFHAGKRFETYEEEIQATRGLPSSHTFERQADFWQQHADVNAGTAADYAAQAEEIEECAAQLIAEDEARRDQVETVKNGLKSYVESQQKWFEAIALDQQNQVEERRRNAQKAREFEARWSFDPYTDPLLDRLERAAELRAERKLTGAKPKPKKRKPK